MLEPHGLVGLAVVYELGCEDASGFHRFTGVVVHLVDDRESVAAAQSLWKSMSVEKICASWSATDSLRLAASVAAKSELLISPDAMTTRRSSGRDLFLDDEILTLGRRDQHHYARRIAQLDQPAVLGRLGAHHAARDELAQSARFLARAEEPHGVRVFDAQPCEQARDRIAALDALFAPVGFFRKRRAAYRLERHLFDDSGGLNLLGDRIGRDAERSNDAYEGQHGGKGGAAKAFAAGETQQLFGYNGDRLMHDFPRYSPFPVQRGKLIRMSVACKQNFGCGSVAHPA